MNTNTDINPTADVSQNHALDTAASELCGAIKGLLIIRDMGIEPCQKVWDATIKALNKLRNELGLEDGGAL